jgi:ribosome maturation protein Sdo1
MIAELFIGQVKGDFQKGLSKIAKAENVNIEDVQVKIKISNEEQGLSYSIYRKWRCAKEKSTFKEIMGIGLDIYRKEPTISPVIYEILLKKITQYESDPYTFSAFLFERHKQLFVAFQNGNQFYEPCLLSDLFQT